MLLKHYRYQLLNINNDIFKNMHFKCPLRGSPRRVYVFFARAITRWWCEELFGRLPTLYLYAVAIVRYIFCIYTPYSPRLTLTHHHALPTTIWLFAACEMFAAARALKWLKLTGARCAFSALLREACACLTPLIYLLYTYYVQYTYTYLFIVCGVYGVVVTQPSLTLWCLFDCVVCTIFICVGRCCRRAVHYLFLTLSNWLRYVWMCK